MNNPSAPDLSIKNNLNEQLIYNYENYNENLNYNNTNNNNSNNILINNNNSNISNNNNSNLFNIDINYNDYYNKTISNNSSNKKNNNNNILNNINDLHLSTKNLYTNRTKTILEEDLNKSKTINTSTVTSFFQSNYLYTIDPRNNNLISFNLTTKLFSKILYQDNTNNIFINSLINIQKKFIPNILNINNGVYIIINKYLFFYNAENNTMSLLTNLISSHNKCCSIICKNEIFIVSGENCYECEKFNLFDHLKNILPQVNSIKINSSLIKINNKLIFCLFGENNNYIEKLDITNTKEKWEIVNYNIENKIKNNNIFSLSKFTCFLDDYLNIIILGGENELKEINNKIYLFNIEKRKLLEYSNFENSELFHQQNIQIDEDIFLCFDLKGNVHSFDKEFTFHKIFNGIIKNIV